MGILKGEQKTGQFFAPDLTRRKLLAGLGSVPFLHWVLPAPPAHAGLTASDATWDAIKEDIFDRTAFEDGSHIMVFDAPDRAHDASLVPIGIKINPEFSVEKLTLVIDENPIPLAARFVFGKASASASIETRVRVNAYSYVRALAETADGRQFMVKKFVKATGGCGAPSGKDPAAAEANMGEMRLRRFALTGAGGNSLPARDVQMMIRHPNHTGFQMDQVSLLFIPPHFIETIEIRTDDDLIMRVEGGISLSEDPNIRFSYYEKPNSQIHIRAVDTDQRVFEHSWSSTES